ncbi:cytochrome aa3 quinol oxidase subunit IV [Pontibacillus marinus]|uniref:Quinol oxidase subunit 4 n=1 Tax=Pontibacillus marinus BH030004 = DSM 16465 TaxID=1385511 RepID=A0A0A5FXC7_9BACI|nr:cytochrome aa3 quinol oxidase subunit IV [Pontibacillus marinus]KGX83450.1 quinol oxidase subunit 4 [Pontibacillus marinus BH030004 = DSM 16465]
MAGNNHNKFPWNHVLGFIFSIVLTLLAVWAALYSSLSITAIVWTIVTLALLQAAVQLFMFMHIGEGEGKAQKGTIYFSAFIAVVIVAGSIWVMNAMMHSMM